MSVRSFRELLVWQRSVDLTVVVYRLTQKFPKHETYGLTSQMQRAAVSVAANIAEGHSRESSKEFLHHLSFSLGSLAELETHLQIAQRLGYLTTDESAPVLAECDEIGKMLRGLQKSIQQRLNPNTSPPSY